MSARRHGVVALLLAALVGTGAPLALVAATSAAGAPAAASPTDEPTSEPTDEPDEPTSEPTSEPATGAFEVDDAQLRWAVNDETNNRAFAPGTINFLSAGKVPDPGRGGQTIVDGFWKDSRTRAWRAQVGRVRVEKLQPDATTYALATFGGLDETVAGTVMSGTNGPFSGHQVVIDGGTGEVDTDAGTATIRWKGSFSVVYYSGMTFFTVSDPVLTVRPGGATLRATLAGYASSMEDQSIWRAVDPEQVVLAALPKVDLTATAGFTVQPRYRGVHHDAPGSEPQQVRSGDDWGAFPASYLTYLRKVGSAAYWYSSGGSADAHKVPEPLTLSYEAGAPIEQPTDPATETPDPTPTSSPTTTVNPPPPTPTTTVPPQPPGPSLPPQPDASAAPSALAAPGGTTPSSSAVLGAAPPSPPTAYALASSEATPPGPGSGLHWTWFAGSSLLLAAAALSLIGFRTRGRP